MNISCKSIINPERPMQGIIDLDKAEFEGILLGISAHFPQTNALHEKKGDGRGTLHDMDREGWLQRKYAPETIVPRHEELLRRCKEHHIRISAISVPCIPYGKSDNKAYVIFMKECVRESIRLCRMAGCGYLVVPPLSADSGMAWEINKEFYLTFTETAKEYGVCILLKNQGREYGGRFMRGNCAEPYEAVRWVDQLNCEAGEELFGFCLDTGICSLCGNNTHEFITGLGKRIKVAVLRDCASQKEMSMLPFTCADSETDWLGVIRGLRNIDFDNELVVDFSGTMRAFSPLLRPALYHLAKEIAEYFELQIRLEQCIKKYEKIVLFGAGNMCRNYMKNYGEMYTPLFTCDNNSKLWGTEFCGLEVKSPEALKNLPENCGILICNIYYREIEEQLREMGIRKNVEYFNDEYMPSFYFDRLDLMDRE